MTEHIGLAFALIIFLGIFAQWLAWRLKLPAILFLLLFGLFAGPVMGWVRPDEMLGDLLFPMVSLGVAVILFEGSLTLRVDEIRGQGSVVRNLVTLGVVVTWLSVSFATWWLLQINLQIAFLFGALATVTGPTVITPLLRSVRPTAKIANILRWEGILVDPVGALLAVVVFEFILSGQQEGQTALTFVQAVTTGTITGLLGALFLATLLRRHLIPDYLHNVVTLALVLVVFTSDNYLQKESGLLGVTVMGIMLGNMKNVSTDDILDFKESLSILLISVLFIVLAARIEFADFQALGLNALWILAIIIFIARPLGVFLSSVGADLSWREKALIGWIGPRGIVAAAVSALFALQLEKQGYPEAKFLVPLTFMVIIGTVVLHSFTARLIAKRLKVSEPDPRGILIVGGNPVALAVAEALSEQGFHTLVADSDWNHIRVARMKGLDTYYGNVVSQHAERNLDLIGIGRLFAMSQRPNLNALACVKYRNEFATDAVFALKSPEENNVSEKRVVTARYRGSWLFSEDITLVQLAELLNQGAEIRTTLLTNSFDFNTYRRSYGKAAIPLFAIDDKERLHVFTADKAVKPKPGWRVMSLLPAHALDEAEKVHLEIRKDEQAPTVTVSSRSSPKDILTLPRPTG